MVRYEDYQCSGLGKTMQMPLQHVPDSTLMHYRLQLNAYKYLIEKYYGKKVIAMYIVGMHPDNGREKFVDEVPLMSAEIEALMEEQRRRSFEVKMMMQHDFMSRDPLGGGFDDEESPRSFCGRVRC